MKLDPSERTRATQRQYQEDKEAGKLVGLENEPPIQQYKYWKLVVNRYPYDAVWRTSMLLVYKDISAWEFLSEDAIMELHELKISFKRVFDRITENGDAMTSVNYVPHVHLLQGFKGVAGHSARPTKEKL
jgi:hypothetical protein